MSTEEQINKARAFFDKVHGESGEKTDPEVRRWMTRMERQLAASRKDKDYKQSIIKTLGLLDRDASSRSAQLEQRFVERAAARGRNLSGDQLKRLSERALPRELRDMRKQGLDVLTALSSSEKMTGEQLRKFNDQITAFTQSVEDLRAGKPAFAQDSADGGLTLTERVRQYREGKLADDARHKQLLEKLEETRGSDSEDKYSDIRKLGLTALLGPASPLAQLWFDVKDDVQKMGLFQKKEGDEERRRFAWWTAKEEEKEDGENRQTNLLQRMLKAFREKAKGTDKRTRFGAKWLFGEDDDGLDVDRRSRRGRLRRWGRTLGRTARRTGARIGATAGRVGRAVATGARAAWTSGAGLGARALGAAGTAASTVAAGASKLGGVAMRGLAAVNPVAAIAGAGYGGWKIGEAINDHLLTDEQKEWIGRNLYESVEFVSSSIAKGGAAISAAGTSIRSFFSRATDAAGDAIGIAVDGVRERVTGAGERLRAAHAVAVDKMSGFFESADKGLRGAHAAVTNTLKSLPKLGYELGAALHDRLSEGVDAGGKWLTERRDEVASAYNSAKTKLGTFFEDRRADLVSAAAAAADSAKSALDGLVATGANLKDAVDQRVKAGAEAVSNAYTTASTRMSEFFDTGMKAAGDTLESVRKRVVDEGLNVQRALSDKLLSITGMFDDWSSKAKNKLDEFWDTLGSKARSGMASAVQYVKQIPAKVAEKAADVAKAADAATGGQLRKAANFFGKESKGLQEGRFNADELAAIDSGRAQGEKFKGGSGMTAETKALVTEYALKHGQNPEHALAMVQMESGGNANAVSATGAVGLMQFTGGTGRQYGIKNRFDPRENVDAGMRLMKDNAAALRKAGIEPTLENLYLAHQQGAAGAVQIINAGAGKGELSDKVRKNMGLNFGDMSAADYLDRNKEKIHKAQASAITNTYTGQYAKTVDERGQVVAANTVGTPLAPAAAAGAPTSMAAAVKPATVATTAGASTSMAAVKPATVATTAGVWKAGVQAAPVAAYERVSPQSSAAVAAATAVEDKPVSSQPASTGSTSKVGLSDMDFFVNDLGLIVMNRGYVG